MHLPGDYRGEMTAFKAVNEGSHNRIGKYINSGLPLQKGVFCLDIKAEGQYTKNRKCV